MRESRYTEEQIAFIPNRAELGTPVTEVCRKLGIAEQTFHRWKRQATWKNDMRLVSAAPAVY
jgi:putative transposase